MGVAISKPQPKGTGVASTHVTYSREIKECVAPGSMSTRASSPKIDNVPVTTSGVAIAS